MSFSDAAVNASKGVHAIYRIVVTTILGFYLIREVLRRERKDED